MSDASRAANRRYYQRNRQRILAKQRAYRATKRQDPEFKAKLAANTRRWRARFKAEMHHRREPGRAGDGLSPEGHRYRAQHGLPVAPWPVIREPRKARRATVRAMVEATHRPPDRR